MIYSPLCCTECVAIPIRAPKGGVPMELFTSFLLSVMAGIVTHYVCKWLDGE